MRNLIVLAAITAASTRPATSPPRILCFGRSTPRVAREKSGLPRKECQSAALTDVASTFTRTSSASGAGFSTSAIRSDPAALLLPDERLDDRRPRFPLASAKPSRNVVAARPPVSEMLCLWHVLYAEQTVSDVARWAQDGLLQRGDLMKLLAIFALVVLLIASAHVIPSGGYERDALNRLPDRVHHLSDRVEEFQRWRRATRHGSPRSRTRSPRRATQD